MTNDSAALAARVGKIRLVIFDFDGVFTDNSVLVFEDGTEAVRCWRGDGIGLERLARAGLATMILSTEINPVVLARSKKLGIRAISGCKNKCATLEQVMSELRLSADEVAFVGNDVNDLACLSKVGLPIVVADAHPDVVERAAYRTAARGGHGAVREVCDLLVRLLERGDR